MKLSLGPIPYFWERQRVLDFYREVAHAPLDVIYLGETVCSKRRELRYEDWLSVAEMLAASGREVVLSTLVLIEADSELAALERIVENGQYLVEANDMAAVGMLSERGLPFIAGAHVNLYNAESLALLARLGARRWVAPVEIGQLQLAALPERHEFGLETELIIYGNLPLAFSARCFTARACNLPKDACGFVCRNYPQGLPLGTMEGQPLFVLNGIQTLSARVLNLVGDLREIEASGVDVVRITPSGPQTIAMIERIRAAIDGCRDPRDVARELAARDVAASCNGYWRGRPGSEWIQ